MKSHEHYMLRAIARLSTVVPLLWMVGALAQDGAPREVEAVPLEIDGAGQIEAVQICDSHAVHPQPPVDVVLGSNFARVLEEARRCRSGGDSQCALRALGEVDKANLTPEERAIYALESGDIELSTGRSAPAVERYEEGLAGGVEGHWRGVLAQRIARLHLEAGEFAAALRVLAQHLDCTSWSADSLLQRALAYRGIHALAHSLDSLSAASRLYELEGRALPAAIVELQSQTRRLWEQLPHLPRTPSPDAEHGYVFRFAPEYPLAAMQRGLEGSVEVEFTVNDLGKVEGVRIVESSDRIFERPAIEAISRFIFAPRLQDGLPVPASDRNIFMWTMQ